MLLNPAKPKLLIILLSRHNFNPAQFDIRPRPERILNFSDRVHVLYQTSEVSKTSEVLF